ncbi:MAG: hypothetical protein M3Z10_07810 [Gemmatimonadota bacterium]|nr:hypothetical protein [Gemmatimonadota bacterium]
MIRFAPRRQSHLATTLVLVLCISCKSDSTGPGDNAIAPGEAVTTVGATELRIAGGSTGGEFLLVVSDTATTTSATSAFQLVASGIGTAGSVSAPATSLASLSEAPLGTATQRGPRLDFSFAARLNERARARLTPMIPAARRPAPSGRRSSLIPSNVQVGDIVTFNVSPSACDAIVNHGAQIVAIGSKAIIAVDTLNPAGGFSTADYNRFAANFDTLVYPLDVANFGSPTDIDGNGHIVLLFTRAVNELTARSSEAFTGGFFFDRDLFPTTSTTPGFACPGSNFGEMFYLLSPDPTGAVNGNVRTRGFVDSLVTPLIGHEFQHLINGSRRTYVTHANDFEVVWLNEGLSHIAEELLFFRQSGLAPRTNITISTLRGSGSGIAAFNEDQSSNAGRYEEYLKAPSTSSPIRDNDSLSTRGATYDFLRYATDRKLRSGGVDADVWTALVNSKTTGIDNLRAVYGTDIGGLLRDWSVSQYTDDVVTNESADYTQPSWNWHNLFQAFNGGRGIYPLVVTTLPASGTSGSVIPGGAVFYRFAVPANGVASLTLTGSGGAAPPTQGVVVRLR